MRRGLWRPAVVMLLMLTVLTPTVAAEAIKADLKIEGTLLSSEATVSGANFQGLFLPSADSLRNLSFRAPVAHVAIDEWQQLRFDPTNPSLSADSLAPNRTLLSFHDALMTLDGVGGGSLGLYPTGVVRGLEITSEGPITMEPRGSSHMGNQGNESTTRDQTADPEHTEYSRRLDSLHIEAIFAGQVSITGGSTLWLRGPIVQIQGAEGTERIATGTWDQPDPIIPNLHHVTIRVAVVSFDEGNLSLDIRDKVHVLTDTVSFVTKGTSTLTAESGEIETPTSTATISNAQSLVLKGDLAGHLESENFNGATVGELSLSGNMDTGSLTIEAPAPFPKGSGIYFPWLALGLGIAAVTATGGIVAARRRPTPPAEVTLDEVFFDDDPLGVLQRAANAAVLEERWRDGLTYLSQLKLFDPQNPRVYADEAFCHSELGSLELAMAAYAEASKLSDSGEFDYQAALLAAEHNLPADEIEAILARALLRSPELAEEIRSIDSFHALAGRPRFEATLREALEANKDAPGPS